MAPPFPPDVAAVPEPIEGRFLSGRPWVVDGGRYLALIGDHAEEAMASDAISAVGLRLDD